MKIEKREVAYVTEEDCISCNTCVITCPHGAIFMASNNKARVDESLCQACKECIVVCPVACISMKELNRKK